MSTHGSKGRRMRMTLTKTECDLAARSVGFVLAGEWPWEKYLGEDEDELRRVMERLREKLYAAARETAMGGAA